LINLKVQHFALMALFAAALFGLSTPLAKLLLSGNISPIMLAGLLYLGSGFGLLIIWLFLRLRETTASRQEKPLQGNDWFWLAGATICGGGLAPVLLLWGLSGSGASSASLLLNLEGVLTTLVAAIIFREAIGREIWLAVTIMLIASFLLAYDPSSTYFLSLHSLAVIGGCLFWAFDNNLTRNISASDPVSITMIKGLVAGSVNLPLAVYLGYKLPNAMGIASGMVLGLFSYGISLVLFIYALRHIGSARTAAHFSTAPFFGALLAVVLLGEPLTLPFLIALGMMILATWIVLREAHEHEHQHVFLMHEHRHIHDEHHQHSHDGSEGDEPHSHPHVHEPMTHSHAHLPDIHHRHKH
jgi:drug/metabolite transporter (DMT)-like permease